jgi:hypothetical protein
MSEGYSFQELKSIIDPLTVSRFPRASVQMKSVLQSLHDADSKEKIENILNRWIRSASSYESYEDDDKDMYCNFLSWYLKTSNSVNDHFVSLFIEICKVDPADIIDSNLSTKMQAKLIHLVYCAKSFQWRQMEENINYVVSNTIEFRSPADLKFFDEYTEWHNSLQRVKKQPTGNPLSSNAWDVLNRLTNALGQMV